MSWKEQAAGSWGQGKPKVLAKWEAKGTAGWGGRQSTRIFHPWLLSGYRGGGGCVEMVGTLNREVGAGKLLAATKAGNVAQSGDPHLP